MHSAPVFLKSVPIVTTSRKSAKLMTACSEEEPITMSFTVKGEEAEPDSVEGGSWLVRMVGLAAPTVPFPQRLLPENRVPS